MGPNVKKPKYQQIRDELAFQITAGILKPGAQLPSEQELSSRHGVSRLTTRQALSHLSREGIIHSVQGKGSFVSNSKSNSNATLKTIHLLTSSFHEPIESDAFQGSLLVNLCQQANLRDMSVTVSLLPRHQSLREFLRKEGIPSTFRDGVIIAGVPFVSEDLQVFYNEKIPFAVLPERDSDLELPSVGTDDCKGIRSCLETLLQCGHRQIAMTTCQPGYCAFGAMLEVYKEMMSSNGIEFNPELIVSTTPWDEQEGRKSMLKLLERGVPFSALLTSGDRASAGAVNVLLGKKFRIPEDVSVAVYDRYPWMDILFPFRLCGVQQNLGGISHALLDLLEEQRRSGAIIPRSILVAPDFISGDTCGYHDSKIKTKSRGHK
ncbi:MAG: GntR family transcriptional regulator [Victivallales bacterium]